MLTTPFVRFRVPGSCTARNVAHVTLLLCASGFLLPRLPRGLNMYDEGLRLYGAMRVLQGAQPYHDFYSNYGPAQFYWPALLFKVFGQNAMVARWGGYAFLVASLITLLVLVRRAGLGAVTLSFWYSAVILPLAGCDLFAHDPALALSFCAAAVLTGRATQSRSRLICSGALIGLAGLFRHDFGLFGLVAILAALAWSSWAESRTSAASFLRSFGCRALWIVAGAAAVALPVYGLLAVRSPEQLVESLLVEPQRMMVYRRLPYAHGLKRAQFTPVLELGSLARAVRLWVMLAPLLVPVVSLPLASRSFRDRLRAGSDRGAILVFLLVFSCGSCVYALGRSDVHHVYPLHCAVAGGLAVGCGIALGRIRRLALRRALVALAASAVASATLGCYVLVREGPRGSVAASWHGAEGLLVSPRLRWVETALSDIARYGNGEPFLIAAGRHDRVHKNDAALYFFAGLPAATYYHDYLPGLTTNRKVQSRMVAELEQRRTRLVLVFSPRLPREPNPSRRSSGITLLDDYLKKHYRVVKKRRAYGVLVRR